MKFEVLILLYGFYPISTSEKTNSFWKTVDKYIASKKGDWRTAYHLMCYEWRYDKSIIIELYNYIEKNYPFPIPKALFFSDTPSWLSKTINNKRKEYYKIRKIGGLAVEEFQIEDFANKWLRDCLSGESFFQRNRDLFTINNVNMFFKNSLKFQDDEGFCRLIKQYYSSKIYPIQNAYLINILAYKFKSYFNHPHVIKFLEFIHQNKNIRNFNFLQDLCDYFIAEIINTNDLIFSFKGRTWRSLFRICNEWHGIKIIDRSQINQDWEKYSDIEDIVIYINDRTWEITQITTGKLLYEEGNYMRHCCYSYIEKCINGVCAMFSLRCYENEKMIHEKSATIEISDKRAVIQARGRFNNVLDKETIDVINQWKVKNGIKERYECCENDEYYDDDGYFDDGEYYEPDEYYENDDYYKSGGSSDNYFEYRSEYENYNENDDDNEES